MVRLADSGEISEEIASVEGLARPRQSHEDQRLVLSGHHHVPVRLLAHCEDVRGNVFSTTASEHVYYLHTQRRGVALCKLYPMCVPYLLI